MKGAVAVMLHLLQNTVGYDLLLTGDEEIGGKDGTGYILESNLLEPYQYVITGEPTGLVVAAEEKGVMWLDAVFEGKSAHAAKPWEGINPLFKLNKLLTYLQKNYSFAKEAWKTSVTPTLIKSGNGQNQIAETIKLGIDSRYIPGDDPQEILSKLKPLCDQLDILHIDPPLYSKPSSYTDKLIKLSGRSSGKMHWATDARYFESTPAVIYGPSGEGMHSSSEYVDLSSLETMYQVLSQLINNQA
jgi:succinyl-diaminopimelate desuccinylase